MLNIALAKGDPRFLIAHALRSILAHPNALSNKIIDKQKCWMPKNVDPPFFVYFFVSLLLSNPSTDGQKINLTLTLVEKCGILQIYQTTSIQHKSN